MTETTPSTQTSTIDINIRKSHLVMFLVGLFVFALVFYWFVVPSLSHDSKIQKLKQQITYLEGKVEIYKFNSIQGGAIASITKAKNDQIASLETSLDKTQNQLDGLLTSATMLIRTNTKLETNKDKWEVEKQKLIADVERANARLSEVKSCEG